jgi:hypothetical protein
LAEVNHSSAEPAVTPDKWTRCSGQQFRKLAQASLSWLESNQQFVNKLNVFPVPDGDTGTNMVLTMRSACDRLQDQQEMSVGKMADRLAQGALMGARGNSGVILSQIWRGLAQELKELDSFGTDELARAIRKGSDTAYKGVMRPVEGTILTVIREGAEEAEEAARKSRDLRFLLERLLERCQQALIRTPELLPILKQAGVVDAGGQGLVFIFEGMLRYVHGPVVEAPRLAHYAPATAPAQALAMPEGGVLKNPYDVQFILLGRDLNLVEVRAAIDAMGDSTVVVGDSAAIKVHIHVKDPGLPLTYGSSLGTLTDVVIENMQMQMEEIVYETAMPVDQGLQPPAVEAGQISVVAVVAGEGLAQIFRSLGATDIVSGGQTNNPSTEEIFQAIERVPTDKVIVLPNNKNIVLASESAGELSSKQVSVVPTITIPQGISALLCLNPNGDLTHTSLAMQAAADQVSTGQITRATRSVTLDGVEVREGQIIGLADGRLCASGTGVDEVLAPVLHGMHMDEREIVSVYYGEDVTLGEAEAVRHKIGSLYPEAEVELLAGGQPHYFYILGAE